jgi:hypothetical protein
MAEKSTVDKTLPQECIRGEIDADICARTPQFSDDTVAVGHENDVATANVAQVGAEMRLEVTNANCLHASRCGS